MNLEPKYKITRDEDHTYTVEFNGETIALPGVTGILEIIGSKDKTNRLMGWAKKQALLKVAEHIRAFAKEPVTIDEAWIEAVRKSAWKRDRDVLKAAGDLGTRLHQAIDLFIEGKKLKLDEDIKKGYDNFHTWLKESGIKIIKGDTYVASIPLHYGGAADAVGEKDGKLILLDWKSSNYISDSYAVQTAAYAIAFDECFGTCIERAIVVRMGKEIPGDVEPKEVNLPKSKTTWLHALDLHEDMKGEIWKI